MYNVINKHTYLLNKFKISSNNKKYTLKFFDLIYKNIKYFLFKIKN